MSLTKVSQYQEGDIVERLGGREAILHSMEILEKVSRAFDADREFLLKEHPHKWVVMGVEGLLACRDTFEQAHKFVRDNNLKNPEYLVKYLDPNPPIMIL